MRLKKYQKDETHAYTFGVFPTLELLHHQPRQVQEVLLSSAGAANEGVGKIQAACRDAGIPLEVNDKLIERIAPKENTYAVGVFEKYEGVLDQDTNHLVLANPSDMGNLGTIIRTMIGFGVSNLALIRPAADIFDPRTIRASMGAVFRLNFAYFESFDAYRTGFQHHLYPFMTDGAVDIHNVKFDAPFALVFGSESSGLPAEFHNSGTSVAIPHSQAIDSLNLSIAIGIALYESAR